MKLLTPQQIHEWDAYTIANEPVTSVELMERAAEACTDFILQTDLYGKSFKVFCGKGNNGGDGLAIARQLINKGNNVSTYIIEFGAVGTEDFQTNLQRLHEITTNIHFIQSEKFFPEINSDDIVIDALYGSGLNRSLKDLSAALVEHINQSSAHTISIDVPSGMFIDKSSQGNTIIKATTTLTFQCLKLCFLVAENAEYNSRLKVLDIGLHPQFLETVSPSLQITEQADIQKIYKPRKPFSHKGTHGHAVIIAGNKGKMGAALLAANACVRAGAGLTTLNIPETYFNVAHTYLPEAMCEAREDGFEFEKINAVGIGPGLGTKPNTAELLQKVLHRFKSPAVIDADALNTISQNKYLLTEIKENSILTPHPKEFERLFGEAKNDFERINIALEKSVKNNFIIVLKGRYTLIAYKGKGWFNTTGNAGLAKGGSGDILTGIITALMAQKYEPLQACLLGVYIHGLAAEYALENQSLESMTATDVVNHLGAVFNNL
jgi:NAD(P)H-hydrate epimerase